MSARVKILYCSGPFSTYDAHFIYTPDKDEILFKKQKDIIELCHKYGLRLDIKVHPCGEKHNYAHFKYLARNFPNTKIIGGYWKWFLTAERIVNKYDVVILDILRTSLIPVMAQKTIPTVLYTTRGITDLNLTGLKKIFYVTNAKKDLDKLLKKASFRELYLPENEQLLKKWFEKRETIQRWYKVGLKSIILRRKFRHEWKNDGTHYIDWKKLMKRLKRTINPPIHKKGKQ